MAETKRYNVGPEHGYKVKTIVKLTDEQAKQMGLTASDVSSMTTTADSLAKRDRYEEAMTMQGAMRERESKAAAEQEAETEAADAPAGDDDKPAETDAPHKKRGTRS